MARALKWFLFYRLVVAILGLGAIITYHLSFSPLSVKFSGFPPHILAAYVILVFACLVNIIYLLLIQYMPAGNERKLALLQISVDVLLVTGLSYFTGGSGSIFVTFYFVLILAANIMGSPKIGLFYASASSILLAAITILYSVSAAGGFTLPLLSPDYVKTSAQGFRFILPYLFFFGLILHFVAYSTGRLLSELAHERRLKAEMAERAKLLESLREMSIGMAHEIRNPLASIKGAVQGLVTAHAAPADTADNRKLLNIVLSESDRLNKIVNDFIEFANDRPLLQQNTDLKTLIQEVVLLLQTHYTGRIRTEMPKSLRANIDPQQIKQVLYNIILNAAEASSEKGEIIIRAGADNNRSKLVIEVIDSGVGIAKENLKRIFEPFFTTKPKGTGLGLAIAYRIVKAHRGEVTAESPYPSEATGGAPMPSDTDRPAREHRGARFTIRLSRTE